MGVNKLSSYVTTFRMYQFCEKLQVGPDMNLLVDGNALVFYLYKHHCIDWTLGGEYAQFQELLIEYINLWKSNGVKLCVVFDGSVDSKKMHTSLQRAQKKLDSCDMLFSGYDFYHNGLFHLPAHTLLICKYTLVTVFSDMCTVVQASCEADPLIAQLAQSGKYFAVLSNDSDFMVYRLPKNVGYVPIDSVQVCSSEDTRKTSKDLFVWIIKNNDVAEIMSMNVEFLPLMACIAGNDYIQSNDLREFHQHLRKIQSKKRKSDDIFPMISRFINSSRNRKQSLEEQTQTLLTQVLAYVSDKNERERLAELSHLVLRQYKCQFDEYQIQTFPDPLVRHDLLSLIFTRTILCEVPLEPATTSSQLAWSEIRYRLYQLLNTYSEGLSLETDRDHTTIVEYYSAKKMQSKTVEVSTLPEAKNSKFIQFCDIWNIDRNIIEELDVNTEMQSLYLVAIFHNLATFPGTWTCNDLKLLLSTILSKERSTSKGVLKNNKQLLPDPLSSLVSAFNIGLIYVEWSAHLLSLDLDQLVNLLLRFSGQHLFQQLSNVSDVCEFSGGDWKHYNLIQRVISQRKQ